MSLDPSPDPSDQPILALSRGPTPSFFTLTRRYLEEYESKISRAVAALDEDQIWWQPAPGVNSVANLLLHLRGNLTLWILGGIAGEAVERHRSAEFTADRTHGKDELLENLAEIVHQAGEILDDLEPEDLGRPAEVQGYSVDVMGAIFHAAEHMSYHTGQILTLTKTLDAGKSEIEFYPHHRGE